MRDCEDADKITTMMKKFDKVREETERIDTIRSYSQVVAVSRDQRRVPHKPGFSDNRKGQENRDRTTIERRCWNCDRNGHISRNCPQRRIQRCYECGSTGHLKWNCDKVKCYNCNKQGHRQAECRSYRSEQRYMGQERRTGNSYPQGRYQNNSRDGYRADGRINTIRDQVEFENTENNDTMHRRNDSTIRSYDDRDSTPNETAPSEAEMIGAIY